MRISDWSSDACSSDLGRCGRAVRFQAGAQAPPRLGQTQDQTRPETARRSRTKMRIDRKSAVSGKSVSVRVDLGGRRIIKKKKNKVDNATIETSIRIDRSS